MSIEHVIVANPDTIFTLNPIFHQNVRYDPLWQSIEAVQRGRVYLAPSAPFGWIDRPPSINRMIGLKWMAATLYPDRWDGDLAKQVKDFYKLYYHVDLSDEKLNRLLEWAKGQPPQ